MFIIAFIAVGSNFYLLYGRKKKTCPVSTDKIDTPCEAASGWNKIIFWISVIILLIGLFVAYIALPFRQYF
jgi:multisubunit Na+/H+ antiporter MnhB subunit